MHSYLVISCAMQVVQMCCTGVVSWGMLMCRCGDVWVEKCVSVQVERNITARRSCSIAVSF